jgi:phage-related minor tail protein
LGLVEIISAGGYTPELNAMRFRGARAAGGPVQPGGSYLVGERGPELFTPTSSGNITPNHAMAGGSTITVNVNGGDPNSIVRALQQYVYQSGPVPINTRAM